MDEHVKFSWSLHPPDFLPEEREFDVNGYRFRASSGTVEAQVTLAEHDAKPDIFGDLSQLLRSYAIAVQLDNHKPYSLRRVTKVIQRDGKRFEYAYSEAATSIATARVGNVTVRDKDGSIVSDSRKEEMDKHERRANSIAKHSGDHLFEAMIGYYNEACKDTNNELFHLYKIRDAVAKHFGGGQNAQNALGIIHGEWSDFGEICNKKQLAQSRHAGSYYEAMNTAAFREPGDTLEVARNFARSVIELYAAHLENDAS